MKKKRTTKTKSKKTRLAQHRRSKTRPEVRFLVMALRRQWSSMDAADRADRVRELIDRGCTRRGLAEELKISPTNVRFYYSLSSASRLQKHSLKNGASAKKLFDDARRLANEKLRLAQMQKEREDASMSDALASDIASFCLTPWEFEGRPTLLSGGQIEQFFHELTYRIDLRVDGGTVPEPASPHASFRDVIKSCCPNQRAYDFWMPWLMDWLMETLLRYAPSPVIRDAALKKATSVLQQAIFQQGLR